MNDYIERKITPEIAEGLEAQRIAFIEKFGREPSGDDPIFFDPDCDTPTQISEEKMTRQMVEAFREAGVPERLIHVYEKTGYIITNENYHLIPKEGRRAARKAAKEFDKMNRRG